MQESLIELLRCPVTRSPFTIKIIKKAIKILDNQEYDVIDEGVLFASHGWFYPVIRGIPKTNIEAINDYDDFLKVAIPDFAEERKNY
jgi:uncharacterized protein YbaR (Trm112 family)